MNDAFKSSNQRNALVEIRERAYRLAIITCPDTCGEWEHPLCWIARRADAALRAHSETSAECAGCAKLEKDMEKELETRDANAAYADQLVEMIGVYFETDHGEHTSGNFPWENAIETMRVAIGTKQSAAETPAALQAVPDNPIAKALTELVRLKNIKERYEALPTGVIPRELYAEYDLSVAEYADDYQKNVDSAWKAARSALKSTAPLPDRIMKEPQ